MAAQKRKSVVDVDETAATPMCASGCGFFGSAATGGLCSKCYSERAGGAMAAADEKEYDVRSVFETSASAFAPGEPPRKKARIARAAAAPSPDGRGADAAAAEPATTTEAAGQQQQPGGPAKPAAANRCTACRKKVGLLGFRCCCGETFCGAHRYAEKHECSFDYKSTGRERIAKNNPVVVADKITRI